MGGGGGGKIAHALENTRKLTEKIWFKHISAYLLQMLGIDKMSPFPLKIFIPARLLSLTGILKISDYQDNTLGGNFAIKCSEHSASIFTKRRTEGLYRRCFLGKLSKMDDPGLLLLNSSGRLLCVIEFLFLQ